jgi:hypothetical protein
LICVFIDAKTDAWPDNGVTPLRVFKLYVLTGTFGRTPLAFNAGSPLMFAGREASRENGRLAECTSTEPGWVPALAVTT